MAIVRTFVSLLLIRNNANRNRMHFPEFDFSFLHGNDTATHIIIIINNNIIIIMFSSLFYFTAADSNGLLLIQPVFVRIYAM
jgi:hypothetical protein